MSVNASAVSRALNKKFTRSQESKSSMVRGYSTFSKGFSVRAGYKPEEPVEVHYITGTIRYSDEERTRRQSKAFAEYTEYLQSLGYTVKQAARGTSGQVLEVTK